MKWSKLNSHVTKAAGLSLINAINMRVSLGVSSLGGELSWGWFFLGMNYPRDDLSWGWIVLGMIYPTGWNFLWDENISKMGWVSGCESILRWIIRKPFWLYRKKQLLIFWGKSLRSNFSVSEFEQKFRSNLFGQISLRYVLSCKRRTW